MVRTKETRRLKHSALIFVEGETEQKYFEALKKKLRIMNASIKVMKINNAGKDWIDKAANEIRNSADIKRLSGDPVFVIFDKNDHNEADLTAMWIKAEEMGYQIGFSNEAFEVWLIAHFEKITSAIMNEQVRKNKLFKHLGTSYAKANSKQIEQLVGLYERAIENTATISDDDFHHQCTSVGHVIKMLQAIG